MFILYLLQKNSHKLEKRVQRIQTTTPNKTNRLNMNSVILKKISQLDYRIYQGGLWRNASKLERYNLIFGWNGGGKTSMSRALSHIANGTIPNELNIEITIGTAESNQHIKGTAKEGFSVRHMHVFNEDYIQNVSQLATDGLETILYLHKDGKAHKESLETLKKEQRSLLSKASTIKEDIKKLEAKSKYILTDITTEINSRIRKTGVRFTENDVENALKYYAPSPRNNDIDIALHHIEQGEINTIQEIPYPGCNVPHLYALTQDIVNTDSSYDRAELGRTIKATQKLLSQYIKKTVTTAQKLEQLKWIFPAITPNIDNNIADLRASCSQLINILEYLLESLESKRNTIDEQFTLEHIFALDINEDIDAINDIISQHNNIASNRFNAFQHLCYIILTETISRYHGKYIDTIEDIYNLTKDHTDARQRAMQIKSKISTIFEQFELSAEIAKDLTDNLARYIGRNELSFEISPKGYVLKRDGLPAHWLSDGERTALAFIYFTMCLRKNSEEISKSIIVIDDPVSSLDSFSLHCCAAHIQTYLINAAQIILLTHNYAFFNIMKRWLKSLKQNNENVNFFVIDRIQTKPGSSKARIIDAPTQLLQHNSEYLYLFKCLHTCATQSCTKCKTKCYPIMNITRRVLETFLGFKFASKHHLQEMINATGIQEDQKKWLYLLTNDWSHGTALDRDSYDFSILSTAKEIAKSAISVLQEDPIHYSELIKSIK